MTAKSPDQPSVEASVMRASKPSTFSPGSLLRRSYARKLVTV